MRGLFFNTVLKTKRRLFLLAEAVECFFFLTELEFAAARQPDEY